MYKIGEFSRMTSLTVKTLRYYDEAGILTPSLRDEESGYRLYGSDDYRRAELILLLRQLDFSISEIRDVLENYQGGSDLRYYLGEKKAQIAKRVSRDRKLMRTIDAYISKPEQEEKSMQYEVVSKTYEPVLVASIRYRGSYEDTGKYYGKLFGAVKGKAAGAPFNRYYDCEYKADDADIEVCVPIKEPVSGEGIEVKRLPAAKVIVTTHKGPYSELGDAYKALTDYAAANHIQCKTPSREIYQKGPSLLFKGNPNNYITEIAFEIE